MSTIPGDCLLSAAFITYAGYFDQSMRHSLFHLWSDHLQRAGIEYRGDLARSEYLSAPDDRLEWQKNCLPVDDLCIENAIMLKVRKRRRRQSCFVGGVFWYRLGFCWKQTQFCYHQRLVVYIKRADFLISQNHFGTNSVLLHAHSACCKFERWKCTRCVCSNKWRSSQSCKMKVL